jgi:hypothetical protein
MKERKDPSLTKNGADDKKMTKRKPDATLDLFKELGGRLVVYVFFTYIEDN